MRFREQLGATETSELKDEYAQFVGRKVLFIVVSLAGIAVLVWVALREILGSANITARLGLLNLRPPTS